MNTFLITLGVFLGAVALMAVGVIFSNRRLRGSCGGLSNFKDREGNSVCDACTKPSPDCTGENADRFPSAEAVAGSQR